MTNEHGDHSVSNNSGRTAPMQDENTTNHSADEAAVRALYQQLMDGWNQGSRLIHRSTWKAHVRGS